MTATSTEVKQGGVRVRVQRFGTFLSGMVMPNIGAFIAWGIVTAFFIETGFTPVPELGGFGTNAEGAANPGLVGPMLTYLLPLLLAYTGGKMVYDVRGGVVGTIMTIGVIQGAAGTPMLLGALICGPLGAYVMKQVDRIWDGKIKPGFEMLVNNFSAGIIGFGLAMAAFFGLAPLVRAVSTVLGDGVEILVNAGLLPLVSIFIEPAKVLFLNNAINHGVLTPLAAEQVSVDGKSILFLLEANPGPGLGLLVAFAIFGVGAAKASSYGAIPIHFIGGIHEIYFPYVLAKPITVVALIVGGATGVATNAILGTGLVSAASPGSILAIAAGAAGAEPRPGNLIGVLLSVLLSAIVTFVIASVILRATRKRDLESGEGGDLSAAIAKTQANKGKESAVLSNLSGDTRAATGAGASVAAATTSTKQVQNIVFACDAGMGSSAMGASVLRNKIKKAGVDGITVVNKSIANLDDSADLIITQRELTDRARSKSPSAQHLSVDNFMNSPVYDEVVEQVKNQ